MAARLKAPRLKVPRLKAYVTRLGFFDAVVAAPSQKAALEAWDVRQNLFAEGAAKVVDDEALAAEALARPGEVLRKPISDDAGYVAAAKPPAKAKVAAKPRPDRSALDAAEHALAEAETAAKGELAALAEAMRAAEAREAEARKSAEAKLAVLRRAVDEAQAAFRKAGG